MTTSATRKILVLVAVTVCVMGIGSLALEGTCDGGEIHDPDPPAKSAVSGMWVQLTTPRRVPWRYTDVCFVMFLSVSAPTNVTAQVTFYGAKVDNATNLWRPDIGRRLYARNHTVLAFPRTTLQTGVYQTVPVEFVAWEPFLFYGIEYTDTGYRIGGTTLSGDAFLYSRMSSTSTNFGKWDTTMKSLHVRVRGEPYVPGPQESLLGVGWQCNRSQYMDGSVCDCGCGLEDPDCMYVTRESAVCGPSPKYACVLGKCQRADWDTSLVGCKNLTTIGTDRTCQCACGSLVDPDCRVPYNPDAAGMCSSWTCSPFIYKDGKTCNCGCGAYDPDCDNQTLLIAGCAATTDECSYTGGCLAPTCNNGHADWTIGEQCDGGFMCSMCLCQEGYKSATPLRDFCVTKCGDNFLTPSEECDGSKFCVNTTCKCDADHPLVVGSHGLCAGCGNGVYDPARNEECDGGAGCINETCKCQDGFRSTDPPSSLCEPIAKSSSLGSKGSNGTASGSKTSSVKDSSSGSHKQSSAKVAPNGLAKKNMGLIVGCAAGIGGGLALVAIIAAALVILFKKKPAPPPKQPDNRPVVMLQIPGINSDMTGSGAQSILAGIATQFVGTGASCDGTQTLIQSTGTGTGLDVGTPGPQWVQTVYSMGEGEAMAGGTGMGMYNQIPPPTSVVLSSTGSSGSGVTAQNSYLNNTNYGASIAGSDMALTIPPPPIAMPPDSLLTTASTATGMPPAV